jgi:N-acetylglucosamine-6-phosphate deacetylase
VKQVFFGARIFDGERFHDDAALVVDGAFVSGIVPFSERPTDAVQHDCGGEGLISPGFIDAQVNGGGGVLLNETPTVEAIDKLAKAHRAFGTTSLLPTVITDEPKILDAALDAAKSAHASVAGALGIHVEGPFIDKERCGAHRADFIRAMNETDADHLISHKSGVMMVTLSPKAASPSLIEKLVRAGIIVSLGHADLTDAEAFAAFDKGASAVTHLYNAMGLLGHRLPGLVGAALSDPRIIAGLIADGHHVAPTAIKVGIAAKGPEGIALVSDAMPSSAGGPDRFTLQGRNVTRTGSRAAFDETGALAGSATTMRESVQFLVEFCDVDLADALTMATLTPARMLGVDEQIGRLATGYRADFVHIGDDFAVRRVIMGGKAEIG